VHQIKNKGSIELGHDADILLYRPGLSILDHHHGNTDYDLYQKMAVPGKIVMTILRGNIIRDNKKLFPIKGKLLMKGV
jgi:dihydroorotase-like cyclic amidohydrolase